MRSLLVVGSNDAQVEDVTLGPLLAGHVRVDVEYCGLCKSDVEAIAQFDEEAGSRFGHEVAGRVVEVASDSSVSVGARVVAMARDGYATAIDIPADRLIPIPDDVSFFEACLAEPVACILAGIERLDLAKVDRACIVGTGFMGLLALANLANRGLSVTVIEPREEARAFAARLGAGKLLEPEEAHELADSVDLVLECSGSQSGLDLAGLIAAIDAQLSIVGYHQSRDGRRNVDMERWNFKCLRVINAHIRSEQWIRLLLARSLRMMAVGALHPTDLVTNVISLGELPEWLATGADRLPSSIKTVVACGADQDRAKTVRAVGEFDAG